MPRHMGYTYVAFYFAGFFCSVLLSQLILITFSFTFTESQKTLLQLGMLYPIFFLSLFTAIVLLLGWYRQKNAWYGVGSLAVLICMAIVRWLSLLLIQTI